MAMSVQTIETAIISASSAAALSSCLVTADTNERICVCDYTIVSLSASPVTFACSASDGSGGETWTYLSGPMNLATNGGIASPKGSPREGAILQVNVGEPLYVITGSATEIGGHLTYFRG